MPELYLRLALPTPLRRLFDYRAPAAVPADAWQPGVRVRVPFGARKVVGILVETSHSTDIPADKVREALELLDEQPLFDSYLLELIHWAATTSTVWAIPLAGPCQHCCVRVNRQPYRKDSFTKQQPMPA